MSPSLYQLNSHKRSRIDPLKTKTKLDDTPNQSKQMKFLEADSLWPILRAALFKFFSLNHLNFIKKENGGSADHSVNGKSKSFFMISLNSCLHGAHVNEKHVTFFDHNLIKLPYWLQNWSTMNSVIQPIEGKGSDYTLWK